MTKWPLFILAVAALGTVVAWQLFFKTLRPDLRLDSAAIAQLTVFDDSDWQQILTSHVDGGGRVDYAALRADREPLDRFVALIAAVGPKSRPDLFPHRSAQLAYYLNAYNALVLFNVIEHMPLASVHDDAVEFFYRTRFVVDGTAISLHALENDVVRDRFHEPRVHFALNCASLGCPRLPREAFSAAGLEDQLSREKARFLHEKRNVDAQDGAIVLSQIFQWYMQDFVPDPLTWIRAEAPDLPIAQKVEISYRPWDWTLNDMH